MGREAFTSDQQEIRTKTPDDDAKAPASPSECSLQKSQLIQEPKESVLEPPHGGQDTGQDTVSPSQDAMKQSEPSESAQPPEKTPCISTELCNASSQPEPEEQSGMLPNISAGPDISKQSAACPRNTLSEQDEKKELASSSLHQEKASDVRTSHAEPDSVERISQALVLNSDSPAGCLEQDDVTVNRSSARATPQGPSASANAHKDGQASVMDVLMDAQKLTTAPASEHRVIFFSY